jgi:dipeptidyl aminopeptidase/acylaminoacyl peptidase
MGRRAVFRDDRADRRLDAIRYAPDGRSILLLAASGFGSDLHEIPLDGGVPRVLLPAMRAGTGFSISRDGRRLVYSNIVLTSNLHVAERRGDTWEDLALTRGTALLDWPSPSPDGRTVALVVWEGMRSSIFTMPVGGGERSQLTFLDAWSRSPVWSPDGKTVAFVSTHGGKPQVWVVAAAGGTPRRVSEMEVAENAALAWAPGKRILCQRPDLGDLILIEADGKSAPVMGLEPGLPQWILSAIYSPDGGQIACEANVRGRGRQIWIAEGGTRRVLRDWEGDPAIVGWAADGKDLYVATGERPVRIERVSVADGTTVPFRELDVQWARDDAVASQANVSADGTRLLYLDVQQSSDIWLVEDWWEPSR